ncbi:Uncharacterised protein [Mycobacteroides abscessus subsp. abscessus]|nr:Uncharacterised protein [Mycobacteroides abscessus subsp. abscessus]
MTNSRFITRQRSPKRSENWTGRCFLLWRAWSRLQRITPLVRFSFEFAAPKSHHGWRCTEENQRQRHDPMNFYPPGSSARSNTPPGSTSSESPTAWTPRPSTGCPVSPSKQKYSPWQRSQKASISESTTQTVGFRPFRAATCNRPAAQHAKPPWKKSAR